MNGLSRACMRAVTRDLLSPTAKSFFILVNSGSTAFMRVSGGRSFTVLLRHNSSESPEEHFRQFCDQLGRAPCYYGQPVTVLLDNDQVFTYFKWLGTVRPSQIMEGLRIVQRDEAVISHTVLRSRGSRIFAVQGVN